MNMEANNARSESWLESDVSLKGSGLFLAAICLVASVGGLLFGFDTAVISGTFGFVEKQFALSKFELGWFGSAALVGCIVGAAVAGWFGDRFGRKPVLIVGAVFFFVSALYSAIPRTFTILMWARVIGGVGVGIASVLAPMYISEFSPPKIRGRLVALYQLSIVIGILLAYYSNAVLLRFSETHPAAFGGKGVLHWALVEQVWRGMFGAEMIPNVIFIVLLLLVPESPRWLVEVGRMDQAFRILARVGGRAVAEQEMVQIRDAIGKEEGSIRELFQPGLRLALIVGLGLSIFGQMTGVNIVVYYGPMILEQAGLKMGSAFQYQVILGFINLVFTLVAIWKVDTWGRRPLLIWGMVVVTLMMGITGLLFAMKLTSGIWIVIALSTYMACEALSICAVIWVLTPEIFPNRIRGRAMSVVVFANWGTNTVSAFLFPWFVDRFGMHAGFFTFSAICLVATVFFWRFVPETKGKSLEEIERYWRT
ncbi:MAG: sugar porter family MFS transporter [Kiritimatiellae bacterium]|nr:sugar porter family MFS transporter [Kiritimatiellia bacterium]